MLPCRCLMDTWLSQLKEAAYTAEYKSSAHHRCRHMAKEKQTNKMTKKKQGTKKNCSVAADALDYITISLDKCDDEPNNQNVEQVFRKKKLNLIEKIYQKINIKMKTHMPSHFGVDASWVRRGKEKAETDEESARERESVKNLEAWACCMLFDKLCRTLWWTDVTNNMYMCHRVDGRKGVAALLPFSATNAYAKEKITMNRIVFYVVSGSTI